MHVEQEQEEDVYLRPKNVTAT